jgi:hypothetical protein
MAKKRAKPKDNTAARERPRHPRRTTALTQTSGPHNNLIMLPFSKTAGGNGSRHAK